MKRMVPFGLVLLILFFRATNTEIYEPQLLFCQPGHCVPPTHARGAVGPGLSHVNVYFTLDYTLPKGSIVRLSLPPGLKFGKAAPLFEIVSSLVEEIQPPMEAEVVGNVLFLPIQSILPPTWAIHFIIGSVLLPPVCMSEDYEISVIYNEEVIETTATRELGVFLHNVPYFLNCIPEPEDGMFNVNDVDMTDDKLGFGDSDRRPLMWDPTEAESPTAGDEAAEEAEMAQSLGSPDLQPGEEPYQNDDLKSVRAELGRLIQQQEEILAAQKKQIGADSPSGEVHVAHPLASSDSQQDDNDPYSDNQPEPQDGVENTAGIVEEPVMDMDRLEKELEEEEFDMWIEDDEEDTVGLDPAEPEEPTEGEPYDAAQWYQEQAAKERAEEL
eukprot:TRINITY_DN29_c0_g1_i1.p1 TRINITY_DN29_c0_g1~~TRINITY_DN29_c0_g1_i1.p1  ORF type:complete len:384 (-),score=45.01 TRINITY_DN29_c0_g1_i1:160-1311(-)